MRRTKEQQTDSTAKQPPPALLSPQEPETAEPAKNVAKNRKEKVRAKEERIRKKTEKRSKGTLVTIPYIGMLYLITFLSLLGKKLGDAAAEKNVSFSSEVATHHIPKDKQRTGLFGMFDK